MISAEISGNVNERVVRVETYFRLKEQNDKLREQNAYLLSQLPSGSLLADTSFLLVKDTIQTDSLSSFRQFQYFPAKVISNSVFLQQNLIMLHRGSSQGVEPNMAVVSPDGIVGTVVGVSKNMSTVMSLLHKQSKVIAVMKKGSGLGEISWDGKDVRFVQLNKIPKTVEIKKGDTVVTSPYSDRFPPGVAIGYVEKVEQDTETNTYILKVKTATNFSGLQHAYVVRNLLKEEMDQLQKNQTKE
ncbi:MAG: rod shape-determining protein MreC [Bacteroidota bacterium]